MIKVFTWFVILYLVFPNIYSMSIVFFTRAINWYFTIFLLIWIIQDEFSLYCFVGTHFQTFSKHFPNIFQTYVKRMLA